MMKNTLLKGISILVLAALFVAALPIQSVFAAGLQEDTPPVAEGERGVRLVERKFQIEQKRYEAQGKLFERSADLLEKAQTIIDRAAENGIDTSAAQSALEDFEAAVNAVEPLYAQAGDLVEAHAGFDAEGKVSDVQVAAETVEKIHKLLDQVRDDIHNERETLQHALWDLFQEGLKK